MLVLSRRLHEKVLFPGIHTAVQIVAVKGAMVRLGIEAPPEVAVLREELQERAAEWVPLPAEQPIDRNAATKPGCLDHPLRDLLKWSGVALGLMQLQLDAGLTEEARATLTRLRDEFQVLRYGVEAEFEEVPPRSAAPARKTRKALLVEDDRNERELLASFLRMSGLDVDTASDGADALDYLRSRGRPDVVLLDMGLPRVDGPTMVREIRRDPAYAGLKIFGVSGHLPDEFDLARGPAGIDRWFQKPLDPTALIHDLTEELDHSACGLEVASR